MRLGARVMSPTQRNATPMRFHAHPTRQFASKKTRFAMRKPIVPREKTNEIAPHVRAICLNATTISVSLQSGCATSGTIAGTYRTRKIVEAAVRCRDPLKLAKRMNFNARTEPVCRMTKSAMTLKTAAMMKVAVVKRRAEKRLASRNASKRQKGQSVLATKAFSWAVPVTRLAWISMSAKPLIHVRRNARTQPGHSDALASTTTAWRLINELATLEATPK